MSSRVLLANAYTLAAIPGLVAFALFFGTGCWVFADCPSFWGPDHPAQGPDSRGHAEPVWGRVGGEDVIVFGWKKAYQRAAALTRHGWRGGACTWCGRTGPD